MATDDRIHLGWADVEAMADDLAGRWCGAGVTGVWGVPRGGVPVAMLVSPRLGVPLVEGRMAEDGDVLVVDDLVDSGRTRTRFDGRHFDTLLAKPHSPKPHPSIRVYDGWVVFPWEEGTAEAQGPTDAVVRLLQHIGEDPARQGLLDTPARVVRAFTEMTAGYGCDPAVLLARTFDEAEYDEMVVLRNIEFTSLCEHHLLPFSGTATVAYIPGGGRVVGLSKLARLVECFAARLQLQERLTVQIADAIDTHLAPQGVGVVLRARHSCMGCRGVRRPTAEMVTSRLTGAFKDDPKARAELLALG